jgi:uncharacterized nucleotidyltransferase DUF6036
MQVDQLRHVVGAAANVTGEREFVVIGSQAILATDPEAPASLLVSMEVDIYPRERPELADEIDGALGDGSQFHRAFGYYAHAVGPETAKAPAGWERRLVRLSVDPRPGSDKGAIAHCLEAHDLVLAKCAAGRDRDWEFALSALRAGLVDGDELLVRIDAMPLDETRCGHVRSMVTGLLSRAAPLD